MTLGTHPYTFGRVSVMRAELLRKDDYHRLMKMGLSEMTGFLQESAYRKEISELAVSEQGVNLMEQALNRNVENTFAKLRKIAKSEVRAMMDAYLTWYDIMDFKTVLRGKYMNMPAEKIGNLLFAAGRLSRQQLMELAKNESVQDVVRHAARLGLPDLTSQLAAFEKEQQLNVLENAADNEHYRRIFSFAETMPKGGKLFREFLEKEIEVKNIVSVLRLKRAGLEGKAIEDKLLPASGRFRTPLRRLVTARLEDAAEALKGTEYGLLVSAGMEKFRETDSLIAVETLLHAHMLKKTLSFMKRKMLSAEYILGYLMAKEREVLNLKAILRGKQLGVDQGFIEEQLVVRDA